MIGAGEDGTIGNEDGSPETTSSRTDSGQSEREPCPDGYRQADKLESS